MADIDVSGLFEEESEDAQQEREMSLLKRHVQQLSNHFEAVQIFASNRRSDGTASCTWGDGNWFARYGQIRHWVTAEDERQRQYIRDEGDDD